MTDIITDEEVPTTNYKYPGILEHSTNYFWRVMAMEPHPSDWSSTLCFQAEGTPTPKPLNQEPHFVFWPWLVITIGSIIDIALLILIIHRR